MKKLVFIILILASCTLEPDDKSSNGTFTDRFEIYPEKPDTITKIDTMSNGTILSITRIISDTSLIQHEYTDDETKDGIMYFRENVFHLELHKGLEKTFVKEVRKSDYSKFYSPGDMTFFPYANLEIKSGKFEMLGDKIILHSYIGIPDSDILDFYEIIIQDSTFEIIEGEQLGE